MDIGRRIREVREDLGMPQAELARRAGVASNTIYLIETGRRRPSVGLLEKIARELRTEPAELMRGPVPLVVEAPQAGQSGQEWARERGAWRHGMSVEEWEDYVRALDSEGLIEESRKLLEEAKMLHEAFSHDKWQRPEGKDRRAALSQELAKLRAYRYAELAVAARKLEDDETFWKVVQAMAQDRDDVAAV